MEEAISSTSLLAQHKVPIIDIAHVTRDMVFPVKSCTRQAATKLHKALMEHGFAFLVNHGISEHELQAAYCKFDSFCSLPEETKNKYVGGGECKTRNYYKPTGDKVPGRLEEYKHFYHIEELDASKLPEDEIPGFRQAMRTLVEDLKALAAVLLQFIAIGCDLEASYFLKQHCLDPESEPALQILCYPPMDDCKPQNEMTSLEKNDKETFTVISQDHEIGLEVLHGSKWTPIGCLPGALLVRVGSTLHKWTDGVYKSTTCRLSVPRDKTILSRSRHAVLFHVSPPASTDIQPIAVTTYEFNPFFPNEPKTYCSLRRACQYIQRRLGQICR